jgi:enoyl-CoA hydratase
MAFDQVLFHERGIDNNLVGIITLNRPEALNALSLPMLEAIYAQLQVWAVQRDIQAVIINSTSAKAFCAGGDIRAIYEAKQYQTSVDASYFELEYQLNQCIYEYPKPYIALLDGITMGGGVGLSTHASHTVASEKLVWAMPETLIGFFTDVGAAYWLSRCEDNAGYYAALSGRSLDVSAAHEMGLVDYYVSSSHLMELEQALCSSDFGEDPHARVTEVISHFIEPPKVSTLSEYYPLIRRCFSLNTVADIIEALSVESCAWADALVADLQQRSPTSLTVVFAMLNRAVNLKFSEVMRQDLTLVRHFLEESNFYEGIRAQIIDKDRNPVWQPSALEEVTAEYVERHFVASPASAG